MKTSARPSRRCWEAHGYPTTCADNGATALDLLRNDHVDPCLILLDLSMPVMSGAMFRRAQRQDPALADLPVIVYSGVAEAESGAHDLDVPYYFKKPLDLDRLVELVHRYC
jgi:CheY-like chemotaxis protein